ncbi:MAG: DUF2851 family protein [Chloroflexota bacterium]
MSVAQTIDERSVVALWERRALPVEVLQAMRLEVIHPGSPSDAGGPDYQDAILAWSGRSLTHGDIEFHVKSSDWYRHGHDRNRAYNRVVLHVVWNNDTPATMCQNGRSVPVLELRGVPGSPVWPHELLPPLAPHPCLTRLRDLDHSDILARVQAAGLVRFQEKRERLEGEMQVRDADEVAYSAVLEAMGHASNRETFRVLAEAAPYCWLRSLPAFAWGEGLLVAAGFSEPSTVHPPARLVPSSWRLSRLRPGNHPAVRLRGASVLLQRFAPRLAHQVCEAVTGCSDRRQLRSLFMVRETFESPIGAGRADELVASGILPLVAALSDRQDHVDALYTAYYSPPATRWTRALASLIEQAGHSLRPRTAAEHQGMHLVFTRHCRNGHQSGCPLCGDLEG